MLIKERMSHPVVSIPPEMAIQEAIDLFKRENIQRAPVIKGSRLVGIVSSSDLLHASPSEATSLSIWELNYLLSKITAAEVMTKDVITVAEDTPLEEAARIMADNQIGGLPVMKGETVVGIITETDLFRVLLELMGARENGVRLTAIIKNLPGELSKLTAAIAKENGNIIAMGAVQADDEATREIMLKVSGIDEARIKTLAEPNVVEIKDLRTTK